MGCFTVIMLNFVQIRTLTKILPNHTAKLTILYTSKVEKNKVHNKNQNLL